MEGHRPQFYIAATIALSIVALATIVGGCVQGVPTVTSSTPGQNTASVSTSPAVISFTFDRPMLEKDVENAFSISPGVGTAAPNFTWSDNSTVLTVAFAQPFQPDTAYTAEIGTGAKSRNGVAMAAPFLLKFSTRSAGTAAGGGGDEPVTFTNDIKPLADARCKGCHQNQMSDYDNIIAKKYVVPGKPDESAYYKKPAGVSEHPGGKAWKDRADLVKQWIAAGAPK